MAAYFKEHTDRLGFAVRATVIGHVRAAALRPMPTACLATSIGRRGGVETVGRRAVRSVVGICKGQLTTTPLQRVGGVRSRSTRTCSNWPACWQSKWRRFAKCQEVGRISCAAGARAPVAGRGRIEPVSGRRCRAPLFRGRPWQPAQGCRRQLVPRLYPGLGAKFWGYRHPAIVEAVRTAAEGPHTYGAQHELEYLVSEKIQSLVPCAERVSYTSSGRNRCSWAWRCAGPYGPQSDPEVRRPLPRLD